MYVACNHAPRTLLYTTYRFHICENTTAKDEVSNSSYLWALNIYLKKGLYR